MININKFAPKWTRFMNKVAKKAPFVAHELIRLNRFNPALAKDEDIEDYLQHFFATDPNIFYELADDLHDFDVS